MWKAILVLMAITTADQRIIVQQPLDGHGFQAKAECDAYVENWQKQAKQPELLKLAETRAPAHRGNIKWVNLIDAGCADPTWSGTDHTRERVPVVGWGRGAKAIGQVAFTDVAASVAAHLGVPSQGTGRSFL